MTLGRHVSLDGTLIIVLVNYAIEHRASETLALYLPKLDAETIKGLKTRLGALPPSGTPATGGGAVRGEIRPGLVRFAKSRNTKTRKACWPS